MLSCGNLCFSDVIYSHDSFIMCLCRYLHAKGTRSGSCVGGGLCNESGRNENGGKGSATASLGASNGDSTSTTTKKLFSFSLFRRTIFHFILGKKLFLRCFGRSALCWRKGGRKEGSKQSFCTLQIHNQRTEMNVDPLRKPSAVNESTRRAGMEKGRKRTFAKCVLSM